MCRGRVRWSRCSYRAGSLELSHDDRQRCSVAEQRAAMRPGGGRQAVWYSGYNGRRLQRRVDGGEVEVEEVSKQDCVQVELR